MQRRVVIIGGVAGGATLAARLARLGAGAGVTILERGPDVSFANCGMPYFIGGAIKDRSKLLLHTPQSLQKAIGVPDVRVNTEVTHVDRAKKVVVARSAEGSTITVPYDKLVLSPGAAPFVPPVPGATLPGVFTLRNMQDMDRIAAAVQAPGCKRVAVIGAGFIGLEMAEQLQEIGKAVTVVERTPAVLPQADPEISSFIHPTLRSHNIELYAGDGLDSIVKSSSGMIVKLASKKCFECDAVILCIGVRGDNKLASEAKLDMSARGLIRVNDWMQTSDPDIYAVGDAVETRDGVFEDKSAWVALGNVANMQARVAADHILEAPGLLKYGGSLGTSIVRVFGTTLALTGWTETRLAAAKIRYGTTTVNGDHHAGYYPGAETMTLKITYDLDTGRLFGAQAVGGLGVDKRIDVLAAYIHAKQTIDVVSQFQSSYSPPFGSAKDPVDLACLAARNQLAGLARPVYTAASTDRVLLDVRPESVRDLDPLPEDLAKNTIACYFADVGELIPKLDKTKKYRTLCNWGRTAYFAHRRLLNEGFDCDTVVGGWRVEKMRREAREHGAVLPQADAKPASSKL